MGITLICLALLAVMAIVLARVDRANDVAQWERERADQEAWLLLLKSVK